MKRITLIIITSLLLISCTKADEEVDKEIEDKIKTTYEVVEVPYKTKEVLVDNLEAGEREVISKGENGSVGDVYKLLDNGEKELLTSWVYKQKVDEVIHVGKVKEDIKVEKEETIESNKQTKPPKNNEVINNTPSTEKPTQPTEKPKPVHPSNTGLYFDTREEASKEFYRILDSIELSIEWGNKLGIKGGVSGGGVGGVRFTDGSVKYSFELY